jgi:hypothetical protein
VILADAPRRLRLYIRLEPRDVRRLERAAALLIAGAMVLTFAAHSAQWILSPIRWQVTLAAENNAAGWVASMKLFGVGLAAIVCVVVERQVADNSLWGRRELSPTGIAWAALAAGFLLLSLDELGSLHERLYESPALRQRLPEIDLLEGWAAMFTAPLLLMAAVVFWTAWWDLRGVPRVIPLAAICVLLLLSAPIHEHFQVTSGASISHATAWQRPAWQIVAEEGSELLATFCFLSAGLRFAEYRSRGSRRIDGKVGLEFGWRWPVALIGLYLLGLGVFHPISPGIAHAVEGQGGASNWFPATAALVGCLLAMHLAALERNRVGSPPGSRLALQALACVNLALSVGYAANSPFHHLLDDRPAVQTGWMFTIAAGVLLTGMFAARISSSRVAAAGLLGWSLSFLVRPIVETGSWAVLSLLAQLGLLMALGAMLAERIRQTRLVADAWPRVGRTKMPTRRKSA